MKALAELELTAAVLCTALATSPVSSKKSAELPAFLTIVTLEIVAARPAAGASSSAARRSPRKWRVVRRMESNP